MTTQALDLAAIQINQKQLLNTQQPDPNYQGHSFARWEQQGMLAYAWLETVEPGQWPTGIFVPDAYNLTCSYERVAHQGAMGEKQEALGHTMVDQLRAHVVDVMYTHGWSVIYKTRAGRDIWHQEPDLRRKVIPTSAAADPGEDQPTIKIDNLQPGALRYAAHWIEDDIQVTVRLEARSDDQAQGYLLETWYVGRHNTPSPLGKKRQALAEQRVFPLRHRFMLALEDAGWIVEGEIWRHSSQAPITSASEQDQPEPRQSHIVEVIGSAEAKGRGQQPAYSREVFTREVTFTCIVCKQTVTQQRYPGHTPLYCSDGCKRERQQEKTRERVARHREKQKAEAGNKTSQEPVTH